VARAAIQAGLVLAALAAGVAACGYRLGSGAALADGSHRLAVPVAENRTTEPWAGAHLTRALRLEAERLGLQVAGEGQAPALRARLLTLDALPRAVAGYGGRFATREQEVRVVVELSLEGATSGPLRLEEREGFLSAPDLRGTGANQRLAARRALERLAARAVERLLRTF